MLTEREGWLTLAAAVGVGPRTAQRLVALAGSAAAAARAGVFDVGRCPALGRDAGDIAAAIAAARPRALEEAAAAHGQTLLTPADPGYPAAFSEGPDPPPAVFLRGRPLPTDPARPCVAVVGTRRATPYGRRVARALGEDLGRARLPVVSGLARGIDAAAHAGALAGGGETIAVLGTGVDVVYPPEHAELLAEIVEHGTVVSEHPPGTQVRKDHFPRRNRLIAALSRAVVVVEAPLRSGALGTARIALLGGREVLAVPGPVDRGGHAGCHRLLRDGAALCEGIGDVLEALQMGDGSDRGPRLRPSLPPPAPGPGLVLWSALDVDDAYDLDDLVLRTGLSPDEAASAITSLELDGRILRVAGGGFLRA